MDPSHGGALDPKVNHGLLKDPQVLLLPDEGAHGAAVEIPIRLRPRRPHRRPLAGVKHPNLDAGQVRSPGHGAVQGVYLPHQMAFADAADGGVAGHLAYGLDALGQQQSVGAGARRGQGGLTTGVAAADDDDIKGFRMLHAHQPKPSRLREEKKGSGSITESLICRCKSCGRCCRADRPPSLRR